VPPAALLEPQASSEIEKIVTNTVREDDGKPLDRKTGRLTTTLSDPFAERARLEVAIRQNLAGLGYPPKGPACGAWPMQILDNAYRKAYFSIHIMADMHSPSTFPMHASPAAGWPAQ
jgi:hypothetical protein